MLILSYIYRLCPAKFMAFCVFSNSFHYLLGLGKLCYKLDKVIILNNIFFHFQYQICGFSINWKFQSSNLHALAMFRLVVPLSSNIFISFSFSLLFKEEDKLWSLSRVSLYELWIIVLHPQANLLTKMTSS